MLHYMGRRAAGTSAAEMPLALLIVFIFGVFPFMALSTLCLRAAFVHMACFDAVHAAAVSHTFKRPDMAMPSAVQAANEKVAWICQSWTGVNIKYEDGNAAKLVIVARNIEDPNSSSTYETPLTPPVQTDKFVYQYQVTVSTELDPIVRSNGGLLANIPGFSAPFPVKATATTCCENPSGLIQ